VHFRPVWEGGQYEGDENKRQDALRLAMELGANYIDVELEVLYFQYSFKYSYIM
jgi:3-dehydroquinate dehydratase/shikimate dehydrogenase